MRKSLLAMLFGVLVIVATTSYAADPKDVTIADPKDAASDVLIQGEYEGKMADASGTKLGAQVVALGKNEFDVRLLKGGLPGAGWDNKTQWKAKAKTEDGKTTVTGKDFSGSIADSKLTIKIGDQPEVTLTRVERKSPTLGLKAPEGAVVLFDGTNVDAWQGGKLVEQSDGKYLNVGVKSKQAFQNFTLHLEFRLPYMPTARGQGRANSGLYFQNRYECQVLDSFGLKGENNECAGIYQQFAPVPNMCLPPLVWQTYDIDLSAATFDDAGKKTGPAKATIKHNGVVVHKDIEFKGPTGGGDPETNKPGPFQLQNHGNPVVYRNIWVVEKK